MRLLTDKIRLIPKETCHAPQIYRWFHGLEYEHFFGNMPVMTVNDAMNFNSSGETFMVTDPKNPDEIFGMVTICNIEDRHRNAHIGLLIDKKYQGKKLAKEALKLSLYYTMNSLNLFKIIARVTVDNQVSKKLCDDIGFELEGILKQEVYQNGEFNDVARYRITKGIFNKRFKAAIEVVGE